MVARFDACDLGLLEHQLAAQHGPRVACATPGQVTPRALAPGEQLRGEPTVRRGGERPRRGGHGGRPERSGGRGAPEASARGRPCRRRLYAARTPRPRSRVLTTVVAVGALVGAVVRPRGLHEWVPTTAGVALLAVTGQLRIDRVADVLATTAPIVAFLLAVTVLGAAADRGGVFDALADGTARVAGGSSRRLLLAVLVVGAATTTVLSLDATVVFLTPAVLALARRTGAPPLPLVLAVVYVANAGSLLLPVSNLTNLLVADRLGGAPRFAATTWPAQLTALVVLAAVLLVWHRRALSAPLRPPTARSVAARPDGIALVGTGVAIVALAPALLLTHGWGLAGATAVAAAAAATVVHRRRRPGAPLAPPWRLGLFVAALFVLVDAAATGPLGRAVRAVLDLAGGDVVGTGVTTALAANLFDNLPAFLLVAPEVADGPPLLAALVGANVGATVTTFGSLATLLWLAILRRSAPELAPSPLRFLRWGLVVTPLVLLPTLLVLAATT
ncbi:hypothetical protein FTX61_06255 [Nitriliruptoraceae bacterium ZYF776]|nr:hypothetical protein [Profundirhabdus halotolerans]